MPNSPPRACLAAVPSATQVSPQPLLERQDTTGQSPTTLNCFDMHFERSCKSIGTERETVLEIQDILRVLKLHKIAINILGAISKDAAAGPKMSGPLYSFMIAFCNKNPKNQVVLYTEESLQLFLRNVSENEVRSAWAGWPAQGARVSATLFPISLWDQAST